MHTLAMGISFGALLLDGILIVKGMGSRVFRLFPVFYSYIIFAFCGSLGMYLIYWLYPHVYPSAYWIYYLVTILAEFMILVEVSDQIFRPFPAIRYLGRALTIVISFVLGLVYILPAILGSTHRRPALLAFALRASVTKAIILIVLFSVARHFCSQLGRNVGGLMLGFSIYVAMNIAMLAAGKAFNPVLSANILWLMEPLASALCLLVWTISLWKLVPVPSLPAIAPVAGRDSEAVVLELTRFNSELSKLLHK
ncbi:MAG: hypothetical protein ABSG32_00260 [Terriglobia bacterium]|jgi:hypothetical protein